MLYSFTIFLVINVCVSHILKSVLYYQYYSTVRNVDSKLFLGLTKCELPGSSIFNSINFCRFIFTCYSIVKIC
jgi:hypothetical protein